jgi:hypothetical protein
VDRKLASEKYDEISSTEKPNYPEGERTVNELVRGGGCWGCGNYRMPGWQCGLSFGCWIDVAVDLLCNDVSAADTAVGLLLLPPAVPRHDEGGGRAEPHD